MANGNTTARKRIGGLHRGRFETPWFLACYDECAALQIKNPSGADESIGDHAQSAGQFDWPHAAGSDTLTSCRVSPDPAA
jgi:hypothetical protein